MRYFSLSCLLPQNVTTTSYDEQGSLRFIAAQNNQPHHHHHEDDVNGAVSTARGTFMDWNPVGIYNIHRCVHGSLVSESVVDTTGRAKSKHERLREEHW